MGISDLNPGAHGRRPWNAGNMVGAKRPLKPRYVWAIRTHDRGASDVADLAQSPWRIT